MTIITLDRDNQLYGIKKTNVLCEITTNGTPRRRLPRGRRQLKHGGMTLRDRHSTIYVFRPSKQAERHGVRTHARQTGPARSLTACGLTRSPDDGAHAAEVRCSEDSANAPIAPLRERNSG